MTTKNLLLKFKLNKTQRVIVLVNFMVFALIGGNSYAQRNLNVISTSSVSFNNVVVNHPSGILSSQGDFNLVDGQLESINHLKIIIPVGQYRHLIADKEVKDTTVVFEQKRVMVLPIMGMVHLVGTINVGGIKKSADFQLAYSVNENEEIVVKGSKMIPVNELFNTSDGSGDINIRKEEVKVDINFVLKNNSARNISAAVDK